MTRLQQEPGDGDERGSPALVGPHGRQGSGTATACHDRLNCI